MRNPRTGLTSVLVAAWQAVIDERINTVRRSSDINSEAALQAYFFAELLRLIEVAEEKSEIPKGTRIFVEPPMSVPDSKVVIPDLVICRQSRVIAVIELKYSPRVQPKVGTHKGFVKDGESLKMLFNSRGQNSGVSFVHDRFLGDSSVPEKHEVFYVSRNTLFVWAGVYFSEDGHCLEHFQEVRGEVPVLELVAMTSKTGKAQRETYFGGRAFVLES